LTTAKSNIVTINAAKDQVESNFQQAQAQLQAHAQAAAAAEQARVQLEAAGARDKKKKEQQLITKLADLQASFIKEKVDTGRAASLAAQQLNAQVERLSGVAQAAIKQCRAIVDELSALPSSLQPAAAAAAAHVEVVVAQDDIL
jgi:hypothetical protein